MAAVGAGVAALALAALGNAPAATAGTDRCVGRAEFSSVQKHMSRQQVERIFDTHGRMGAGGAGGFTRTYPTCGGGPRVTVTYLASIAHQTPRVYSKTWGISTNA